MYVDSSEDIQQIGLVSQLIRQIFEHISESHEEAKFTLKISMVQLHSEKIRDLLKSSNSDLKIRENKKKNVFIQDVTEIFVRSEKHLSKILNKGKLQILKGCNQMDENAFYGHIVTSLILTKKEKKTDTVTSAKLNIVDLAALVQIGKCQPNGLAL